MLGWRGIGTKKPYSWPHAARKLINRLPVAAGLSLLIISSVSAAPLKCAVKTAATFESALRRAVQKIDFGFKSDRPKLGVAATIELEKFLETCRKLVSDGAPSTVQVLLKAGDAVLGSLIPAREAATLARAISELTEAATGAESGDTAWGLNNFGVALEKLGRYQDAGRVHRRALAIREKLYGPDHPNVAVSLNNLAVTFGRLNRPDEAVPLLERARVIFEMAYGPEDPLVSRLLGEIGSAWRDLGEALKAELNFRRELAIEEKSITAEHPNIAVTLSNLAGALEDQGRGAEGVSLRRRVLAISEKIYGPEEPELATAVLNLGQALDSIGRSEDAEPLIRRALVIYETAFGPARRENTLVATTLNNLASVLQNLDRAAEALTAYYRALAIYEKNPGPFDRDLATTLNNLASVLQGLHRYDAAELVLRRALAIREKVLGPRHALVSTSLSNLAGVLIALGRMNEAEPLLRRALGVIEESGSGLGQSRRIARQLALQFMQIASAADSSDNDSRLSGAFRAATQLGGPGRTATALMQMSARAIIEPEIRDDARRFESAGTELERLYRDVDRAYARDDATAIASMRERATILQQLLGSLGARIQAAAPRYAELVAPKPLGLKDAAALLGPDEALLVFTVANFKGALLLLTRERTSVVTLHDVSSIENLVSTVLTGVDVRPGRGGPVNRFDFGAAHELYRILLGQVEPLIASKQHLIVVPDGPLSGFPFQLLVTQAPDPTTGNRDARWLIRSHALSVLPSVSSLRALRQTTAHQDPAPLPFIGFGDPAIGDTNARIACDGPEAQIALASVRGTPSAAEAPMSETLTDGIAIADVAWLRAQPRLSGTRCELEALARIQGEGSTIYLGANATETQVKTLSASGELMRYRVVAFSTHGLLPRQARGSTEPGLILTPPERGSIEDDGLLSTSEVAGLKLNADLVLLSACNTAAGENPGSEALSGLARAFFFAGARSVMVSHWPVHDRAALELTTRALGEIGRHPAMGRAEALRRAELSLLVSDTPDSFTDPQFWAPFSLVGEGGAGPPLRPPTPN